MYTFDLSSFFFFNDPAPPEFYTLPLHDALPISRRQGGRASARSCMMATVMTAATARPAAPPIEERGPAAYVAEFVGTFMLVLFIALVVIANSPGGLGVTDWAVIGLVHVFVLMVLVNALGGTSGAHLNPAVTATPTALRQITPADARTFRI